MRLKIIVITLLALVLLAACNTNDSNEENLPKDNEKLDLKELIYDYSTGNKTNETASITSTQLIINDSEEKESVYDLSEEEFFVSIAPFINVTHPCTDHSLTGCQAELIDKDFGIYIEDTEGNIVLDETMKSGSNGFIDLWLPRNKTYSVIIAHEGKQTQSEISTFENDRTCITTMQLS